MKSFVVSKNKTAFLLWAYKALSDMYKCISIIFREKKGLETIQNIF